jgi:hypothetical protein
MRGKNMKNGIMLILIILLVSIGIISATKALIKSITTSVNKPMEYTYKDFSNKDIEVAMRYHGVQSVTITETECYFVRNNVKIPVFTDKCIEYLYKSKQKHVKKQYNENKKPDRKTKQI